MFCEFTSQCEWNKVLFEKNIQWGSISPSWIVWRIQLQKFTLLTGSCGCNSCSTAILNGFSFISFVVVHADDFETLVSCARHLRHFWVECSSPPPLPSSFSLLNTQHFDSVFYPVLTPVCLGLFVNLCIVSLCGTVMSKNLCWNLIRTFLVEQLFI